VDFNKETLDYARESIEPIVKARDNGVVIHYIQKSVIQLLKESRRKTESHVLFDFVYCAGLFDYLEDSVCVNVIKVLYGLVAPGGLLVITNVDPSSPSRGWMDFVVDWYLVYRNRESMLNLVSEDIDPDLVEVETNGVGANIFLKIRKPEHIVDKE